MATTQGIKLDESTRERLKALAKLRNRTPHFLMKEAIETYLNREEQYEQEKQEDAARWERYQLTGEFVSHEKVSDWLQSLSRGESSECPK